MEFEFAKLSDESLIWEGAPNTDNQKEKFSIWGLIGLMANTFEKLFFLFMLIFMTYLYFIGIIEFNQFIIFPVVAASVLLLFFISESIDRKKLSEIKYFVTDRRVIFRSWSLFKGRKFNSIGLENVQKLSLEKWENDVGTIYFMGEKLGEFKNSEHYPALILVDNATELLLKVKRLITESKLKK